MEAMAVVVSTIVYSTAVEATTRRIQTITETPHLPRVVLVKDATQRAALVNVSSGAPTRLDVLIAYWTVTRVGAISSLDQSRVWTRSFSTNLAAHQRYKGLVGVSQEPTTICS